MYRKKIEIFAAIMIVLCSAALMAQQAAMSPSLTISESNDLSFGLAVHNNIPGRYDRNADGIADLIIVDRNGDGIGDYWGTDRNFNGFFDDYQYDRNFDGKIDQWEYDTNYDGISDMIYVDSHGDGKPDLFGELNPVTRTYTWYGDLKNLQAGSKMALSSARPAKLSQGRAAFSE